MSWFSKNYEKATLGGAIVLALGLAYLGWSKFGGVETDFPTSSKGSHIDVTAVPGSDLIPKALQSMKIDRTWEQGMDSERPVDLFVGIPLFLKRSDPTKPIDLIKDPPVHPPIPNTWWLEHRLDLCFADSPARDPDADGFSNLEEYHAKTDPNNLKSVPPLIAKLKFVKEENIMWLLRPGYGDGDKFPFTYEDYTKRQKTKTPPGVLIAPNELFFEKGLMAKRFKLLSSEVIKEMNKSTKVEVEVTIASIEDQRPNKNKRIYKIPAPVPEGRKNEHLQYDRTAVFSLEALGMSGTEFRVEENTVFSLPPKSPKKDYLLKEVSAAFVTVEYPDAQGGRKTVKIKRGTLPRLDE